MDRCLAELKENISWEGKNNCSSRYNMAKNCQVWYSYFPNCCLLDGKPANLFRVSSRNYNTDKGKGHWEYQ